MGSHAWAQTTADVTDEGVVMHVDLAWELEDIQTFVARSTSRAVANWQTPLSQEWQGVEVLDVQEEWLPLLRHMLPGLHENALWVILRLAGYVRRKGIDMTGACRVYAGYLEIKIEGIIGIIDIDHQIDI